ncbi:hypothetical protein HTVC204P_gp14 [Pelagibacter phage HTVC204P]|nr:hypothetical protein HTVC204P_gp14 [Pelagibacter phage HTVC204P]
MARNVYAFSNGAYSDWHRKYDGIAYIDVDSVECCISCYEPLAIIETCFDKGQTWKATTLSKIIASRLNIPCFLVFYKPLNQTSLTFRIKRIRSSQTEFQLMNEDEWVAILRDLHNYHQLNCKKKGKK